ncbi:MAG: DUF4247 domain-containing protein [Actinocatenispora sp.]
MKTRSWFVLAAVLGGIGVLFTGLFLFSGSPRSYVSGHYSRASHYDRGTARAYTSGSSPSSVAGAIASSWRPAGRVVDGSGIYLRYSDDLIAVRPRGRGSLITVDGFKNGYHHYYSHVGYYWLPIGGHGELLRGGGPGAGK